MSFLFFHIFGDSSFPTFSQRFILDSLFKSFTAYIPESVVGDATAGLAC